MHPSNPIALASWIADPNFSYALDHLPTLSSHRMPIPEFRGLNDALILSGQDYAFTSQTLFGSTCYNSAYVPSLERVGFMFSHS